MKPILERLESRDCPAVAWTLYDTGGAMLASGATTVNGCTIATNASGNVTINGTDTGVAVASVANFAMTGDDANNVMAGRALAVPGTFTGGAGNDTILCGNGNDSVTETGGNNIIVVNDGDNTVTATGGRNLILGGHGSNTIGAGGDGEDLMVGSITVYNNNFQAQAAIMREWVRTNESYAARVAHILGTLGGGFNGSYVLNNSTVAHKAAHDTLDGGNTTAGPARNLYICAFLVDAVDYSSVETRKVV